MLQRGMLCPPSTSKNKQETSMKLLAKQAGYLLPTSFMLDDCLAYFSTLNMDMTCSSETLVDFQLSTWHYISQAELFIITAVRTSDPT
jgi:hypothetical protein